MSYMLGFLAFPLALGLIAMRLPVTAVLFGLGLIGQISLHLHGEGVAGLGQSGVQILVGVQGLMRADLLLIPMILAMGNLAFYGGLSTRIYDAAAHWLRRAPGGMAMATILGCAGFSALCGSSTACATSMGRICIPEMQKQGYDGRLATASVAMGGTLGAMIPPSLLFVVYALFSGANVNQMFLAGLLPGLLSLLGMVLAVLWWVTAEPGLLPEAQPESPAPEAQPLTVWPAVLPILLLILGLLTDAASAPVLVLLSLAMTLLVTARQLSGSWHPLRETLHQSLQILVLVIAARVYFDFVLATGAPEALTGWLSDTGVSGLALMGLVALIYLVLGMFLEPATALGVTLPFVLPVTAAMGLEPVWFGVVLIKLLEMGLVTPPVGLNVFIVSSVTRNVEISQTFAGVFRFLMVDILVLLILVLFPILSTFLPSHL
jgi:C4-dicarboxylate transporter DctM subunit